MHHIKIGSIDNGLKLEVDGSYTFGTIVANILEKEKTLTSNAKQQPPQQPKQYEILEKEKALTCHTKQQPLPQKIPIRVFTISQEFDLDVESSDTLDTILSMIGDKEVIPTSLRTVAFPKLLSPPPHGHVGPLYYMDWITVHAPATELIQINVRMVNQDDTFSLEVKRSDTIGNVKDKIFKTERIKPSMQWLYFAGMLLEKDDASLSDYSIHRDSTLDLALKFVGSLEISVELIHGKKVSLLVTSHHEVSKVKSLIREKGGLSLDQPLTLVHAGEKLDDRCMLTDYIIQDETTLCLVDDDDDKAHMMMQIHVKIVTSGKTISLQVSRSDTIHDVKTMIQHMDDDIPACKQILFLPQKRLEDKSTLAEYYIRDQSTLHLLVMPEMEPCEDDFTDYGLL